MSPVYFYKCEHDELVFEVEMDEPKPREICPECRRHCPRKYTPPTIHYQGDGWTGAQRRERRETD